MRIEKKKNEINWHRMQIPSVQCVWWQIAVNRKTVAHLNIHIIMPVTVNDSSNYRVDLSPPPLCVFVFAEYKSNFGVFSISEAICLVWFIGFLRQLSRVYLHVWNWKRKQHTKWWQPCVSVRLRMFVSIANVPINCWLYSNDCHI